MLVIAGEFVVEKGAADKICDAVKAMEQASRKEPGCLAYAFSVDVSDPTIMRIIERWESMEALQAHFKSPHMAAFGQAMARMQPKSSKFSMYEVARELPMPKR